MIKSSWYDAYYSISIFNARSPSVHARKKRVMSQGFSDAAVRETSPYIISVIQSWCDALSSGPSWSEERDMANWAAYNIFDSLGQVLLGASFNTTSNEANRWYVHVLPAIVWYNNVIGQALWLKWLHLDKFILRKQAPRRKQQIDFCVDSLRRRRALGEDSGGRRDIIHHLLQARDPDTGEGYTETELIGETVLLMAAGSDTANTALAATCYFLAHHDSVRERLTEEIRSSFNEVDEIVPGQKLAGLEFLKAVVDESMRLTPPIPMLLPREVCEGGAQVLGEHFPQGTVIGVPTYALHHSEDIFPDAFSFKPERWLEGFGEQLARQRAAFVPFSIGPRACIGRSVALMELHVTIARMVYMYDIRLAPGKEGVGVGMKGEYKVRDWFIVPKEGPVLQFKPAGKE